MEESKILRTGICEKIMSDILDDRIYNDAEKKILLIESIKKLSRELAVLYQNNLKIEINISKEIPEIKLNIIEFNK